MNAIYKKLRVVCKITAASCGRRCAAVRKRNRGSAVIAVRVKIDDAIRGADQVGRSLVNSNVGIADHGAIVQNGVARSTTAGSTGAVGTNQAVVQRSLIRASAILRSRVECDYAIGHHGV